MLDRLRVRAEELLDAVARERYALGGAGPRASRVGATYRAAAELLRLDRISDVQLALAGASGEQERQVRYLLEWLAGARAECVAADELDQWLTWWVHAHLATAERRIPVRTVPWVLASTTDPDARRELAEAYYELLAEHTEVLDGLQARRREALEELGYGSPLAAAEVLSGIDARGLARDAERFLADTEAGYHEMLDWHLPRLAGVEAGDASAADGLRLERAAPFDSLFPGRNLAAGLMGTLAASGLDPLAGGRIQLRTRVERALGPGGAAHPLHVPGEVVLVVSPHAGRPVHASFLHALGEALHHAYTAADLPVEYRRMGDGAVPLAFGHLLQGLLSERSLLTHHYGIPRSRLPELRRLGALLLLLRVRRAAALLRYDAEWLDEPAGEGSRRCAELLTEATGLRHDPRGVSPLILPGLAAARQLRGEQLAAVLAQHMRDRYDEDWFRNPRSGAALAEILAGGRTYSAPETAVQVSSTPLSFDPLRSRLGELMG